MGGVVSLFVINNFAYVICWNMYGIFQSFENFQEQFRLFIVKYSQILHNSINLY